MLGNKSVGIMGTACSPARTLGVTIMGSFLR